MSVFVRWRVVLRIKDLLRAEPGEIIEVPFGIERPYLCHVLSSAGHYTARNCRVDNYLLYNFCRPLGPLELLAMEAE